MMEDLRFSFRTMRKNPGTTIAAILALALGIGATSAIFSVLNAVVFRPLPFGNPDRLVKIVERIDRTGQDHLPCSYADFKDWTESAASFDQLAVYNSFGVIYGGGDEPILLRGSGVSANMFSLLEVNPLRGRVFTADEDRQGGPRVVVLSYKTWQRLFGGDENVIGKSILLSSRDTTVIGIMPPEFKFPVESEQGDFWMPFGLYASPADLQARGLRKYNVVAGLKRGVSERQAQSEMNVISTRLEGEHQDTNEGCQARVVSLHDDIVGEIRPALLMIFGAVSFVLLIACANVANLLLARSVSRSKEIAIRTALGAGKARVVRQLLTESVILALIGGGIGLMLAIWGTRILVAASPTKIPRVQESGIDLPVLGFTFLLCVLTGVVFGLAPALQASVLNLNDSLKEGGRESNQGVRGRLARKALVVAEMAVSLILLICAGLLMKSYARITSISPGFNQANLLTVYVSPSRSRYPKPEQQAAFYQNVLDHIRSLPGVKTAGAVDMVPLSGDNTETTFSIEGRPASDNEELSTDYSTVSPNHFEVMEIPLLKGSAFSEMDTLAAPRKVIINDAFSHKYFAGEEVIGKRIRLGGDDAPSEIIGVVGDVRNKTLESKATPALFVSFLQAPPRSITYIVRTASDPMALSSGVHGAIREVDKTIYLPESKTFEQLVSATFAPRRFSMTLLLVFATVGLILAGTGIYGVMAYSVSQQVREIGIRMALGAQGSQVLRLVLGQGITLALIGIGIGLFLALAGMRFISSMLFEVGPSDPKILLSISAFLMIVVLLACYIPARRALRINPISALRSE